MTDDADDPLVERTLDSRLAYEGVFLRLYVDRVRSADGHEGTREYLRHPGAVMIVPLLDADHVLLERQFRYPLGRSIVEFPAGKIDPGEAPLATAVRELIEETGYRATEWARAGVLHNAAAYSTEGIEIWFARGLVLGERALDHGELIDLITMQESEVDALVASGELTDAKTMIALMWLQKWRAGLWPLTWQPGPVIRP